MVMSDRREVQTASWPIAAVDLAAHRAGFVGCLSRPSDRSVWNWGSRVVRRATSRVRPVPSPRQPEPTDNSRWRHRRRERLGGTDYPRWARAAPLTLQVTYRQPVRYEYRLIKAPTMLIVGAGDHVVPLGQDTTPEEAARLSAFVEPSAAAVHDIPRATRVVPPNCAHISHLEVPSSSEPPPSLPGELTEAVWEEGTQGS
jgi:pimeloyl-ACP methyl ester carboxylesterase